MTDASPTTEVRWDPEQYGRFGDARLRPALELLARVGHEAPRHVFDLGCGRGEIARLMAERWPEATVVGADLSPEMLAQAAAVPSRVHWERIDASSWEPAEPADVIFANALFHWILDHEHLFPRLLASLAPGGVLAVQMPLSWDLPSHRLMRDVLENGGPEGAALGSAELRERIARCAVAAGEMYYALLAPLSKEVSVWETHYIQPLRGEDAVFEWVSGTGLRPILEGLDEDDRARFVPLYQSRLRAAYPPSPTGETLYRFPRLFITATR